MEIKVVSNRKVGLLLAGVSMGAGVYAGFQGMRVWAVALLLISICLAIARLWAPQSLRPVTRLWLGLGSCIGFIVRPIVLGAIFFVIITPVAIATRLGGRDILRLRRRSTESYWTDRHPKTTTPESFGQQF